MSESYRDAAQRLRVEAADRALDGMRPPHNGTETSIEAAVSLDGNATATLRSQVLQAIVEAGPYGMTREELQRRLGLAGDTLRPRVWELLGQNGGPELVKQTTNTRLTRSGRRSFVLVATERGCRV